MKTLYVLRHAKSSWDHPELRDFERPLSKRGKEAAPRIGLEMAVRGYSPGVIISSPAARAVQTVALVAEAARFSAEIIYEEAIYGAGSNSLANVLTAIPDNFPSALIAGHNPGFEQLVEALAGDYMRMPTAALAVIDLEIGSWKDVKADCGSLRDFITPKELS